MDTLLQDGDFSLDMWNLPSTITSLNEACQRVLILLTVPRGDFIYDRNLGCDFSELFTADDITSQAKLLVSELLVNQSKITLGSVDAVLNGDTVTLTVEIIYGGESGTVQCSYSA